MIFLINLLRLPGGVNFQLIDQPQNNLLEKD
jgi:hypothetical protein